MPPLLVTSSNRSQVEELLERAEGFAPLTRGLFSIDVPEDVLVKATQEVRGADADRTVAVPVVRDPKVTGEPMDYHGQGGALPTRQQLRARLGETGAAFTGEGVLVGVVDTGVRPHPWLAGGYLSAMDDFEPPATRGTGDVEAASAGKQAQVGHGTFVTGLVLQQAPAAGVWVERALEQDGTGSVSRVVRAATDLAQRGVHVLNLSLGCPATDVEAGAVMRQLAADLHEINDDLVIVAAAGNLGGVGGDGPADPVDFWPAAVEEHIVAVGAVESPDATRLTEWSNRGKWLDLAAPGEDLLSTFVVGALSPDEDRPVVRYRGWARWSGTSFATAVVSGAIARLMTGPERLSAQEAVARLKAGEFSTGRTEAVGDVPSVPVVRLATWEEQAAERYAAGR